METADFTKFKALIKGKKVHIATHWDCDGVSSGGLLYHLVKPHASTITTISKGEEFLIYPSDCPDDADVIICSDIQPSPQLDPNKTIYIDHHPLGNLDQYLMVLHDEHIQSCSLLIWEKLIPDTKNHYFLFLTLLGYFGDSGKFEDLPAELQVVATQEIPRLVQMRQSQFGGEYCMIQGLVSMFNTGKRMHWNGMVPLELLKAVDNYQDITLNRHPLVDELKRYKLELRQHYNTPVEFTEARILQFAVIECDKNIQGVICARHMKEKPVLVINKYKGTGIASMRVPDELDFDAGAFLSKFKEIVPDIVGGGHEKAGGITFDIKHLEIFVKYIST